MKVTLEAIHSIKKINNIILTKPWKVTTAQKHVQVLHKEKKQHSTCTNSIIYKYTHGNVNTKTRYTAVQWDHKIY